MKTGGGGHWGRGGRPGRQRREFEIPYPETLDAGSWQVRRVEEYIDAHLDAPFDIEEIAEVTGISARSTYRAFKRSRGYSPMAFARQRRLLRARELLQDRELGQTVTAVAFGESPSTVLGRSRHA